MSQRKPIPEPVLIQLQAGQESQRVLTSSVQTEKDLRQERIQEFLQARATQPTRSGLAANSQKAYRQDLQYFLDWTQTTWSEVSPRQIAQFKRYLLRADIETNQRVLSDATVRRVLGTLKNFYAWMVRSHYVTFDPTTEVELPKLKQPDTHYLTDEQVEQIYQAAQQTNLPERNLALISVLLHGLKTEEVSALNWRDYDGKRLCVRAAKADQSMLVPLSAIAQVNLDHYLQWRESQGEVLQAELPLFVSHSRRNNRQRLGYDGIRKLMVALSKQVGTDFHAHQFRHRFTANLIRNGVDQAQVMTLTRHKSAQSLRRYTSQPLRPPDEESSGR